MTDFMIESEYSDTEVELITENSLFWHELRSSISDTRHKLDVTSRQVSECITILTLSETPVLMQQMSTNLLENTLSGLETLSFSDNERKALKMVIQKIAELLSTVELPGKEKLMVMAENGLNFEMVTDKKLSKTVLEIFLTVNHHFLRVYEQAMLTQSQFSRRFLAALAPEGISAEKQAAGMIVRMERLEYALNSAIELNEKYRLYPLLQGTYLKSCEEAELWARLLGRAEVRYKIPKSYYVTVVLQPVERILNYLCDRACTGKGEASLTVAEYNHLLEDVAQCSDIIRVHTRLLSVQFLSVNALYDAFLEIFSIEIETLD